MDRLDSIQQPLDLTMVQLKNRGLFGAWFGVIHETISLTVRLALPCAMKATMQPRSALEQS
jgi:hypothetical protein